MRFDALLSDESGQEDTRGLDRADGSGGGGEVSGGGGTEVEPEEADVVDLRRANGFVRALLARLANLHSLVIPRAELEVRLFGVRARGAGGGRRRGRPGAGVAVMQHSAGAIERTQLRALVLADRITDLARLMLAWAAHGVVLATSPRRWAAAVRDVVAGSIAPSPALALTPAPRPRGPPSRVGGYTTSRIASEFCGHDAETLEVESADGYLLRVIRIANRQSNRVALFQHGLLVRARCVRCAWRLTVHARAARRTPRRRGCQRATSSASARAHLRPARTAAARRAVALTAAAAHLPLCARAQDSTCFWEIFGAPTTARSSRTRTRRRTGSSRETTLSSGATPWMTTCWM